MLALLSIYLYISIKTKIVTKSKSSVVSGTPAPSSSAVLLPSSGPARTAATSSCATYVRSKSTLT